MDDFFNKMAKEIDLESPFVVEKPDQLPGHIANHYDSTKDPDTAPKPGFDAMRRKMNLGSVQWTPFLEFRKIMMHELSLALFEVYKA